MESTGVERNTKDKRRQFEAVYQMSSFFCSSFNISASLTDWLLSSPFYPREVLGVLVTTCFLFLLSLCQGVFSPKHLLTKTGQYNITSYCCGLTSSSSFAKEFYCVAYFVCLSLSDCLFLL